MSRYFDEDDRPMESDGVDRDEESQPNIRKMLATHHERLLMLRETVGMLGDQLQPVLRPSDPKAIEQDKERTTPEMSELGSMVVTMTRDIISIQRDIEELMRRVEV